jgi:hypothetical protein
MLTNGGFHKGVIMKTRKKIFLALVIAFVFTALAALLLLSGYVSVAIWMEGPYFLLTRLLPGSVDTLRNMVIGVAAYYFVASLIALKYSSRRAVVYVVLIVIALNTLGAFVWHRQAYRNRSTGGRTAQQLGSKSGSGSRGYKISRWEIREHGR